MDSISRLDDVQRTIRGQVVEWIRRGILSGDFVPGEKIDQDAVAEEIGVSRMPVREALIELAETGFVITRPHRGTTVAPLSRATIEEIYLIRTCLEMLAARKATSQMTPERIQAMEAVLAEARAAIEQGEYERLNELNRLFHRIGYESCNLPRLYTLIEQLRDQSEVYRHHHARLTQRTRTSLQEHKQILDAWKRGDAEAAEYWTRVNLENSAKALLKEMPSEIFEDD